jgi:hypothetical protein
MVDESLPMRLKARRNARQGVGGDGEIGLVRAVTAPTTTEAATLATIARPPAASASAGEAVRGPDGGGSARFRLPASHRVTSPPP